MNCTKYPLPHRLKINLNLDKKKNGGGETESQIGLQFILV